MELGSVASLQPLWCKTPTIMSICYHFQCINCVITTGSMRLKSWVHCSTYTPRGSSTG